jgi:hypothetical protein
MPITKGSSKKAIASRFKELYADNKKSGKGANGKPRSKAQIVAIALNNKKK